jgi:hypothetical protein
MWKFMEVTRLKYGMLEVYEKNTQKSPGITSEWQRPKTGSTSKHLK